MSTCNGLVMDERGWVVWYPRAAQTGSVEHLVNAHRPFVVACVPWNKNNHYATWKMYLLRTKGCLPTYRIGYGNNPPLRYVDRMGTLINAKKAKAGSLWGNIIETIDFYGPNYIGTTKRSIGLRKLQTLLEKEADLNFLHQLRNGIVPLRERDMIGATEFRKCQLLGAVLNLPLSRAQYSDPVSG